MLEKLGRGELAIITSDAIASDPIAQQPTHLAAQPPATRQSAPTAPQHIHIHAAAPTGLPGIRDSSPPATDAPVEKTSLAKLIVTGVCAAVIIGSLLYIADRIIAITTSALTGREKERIEDIVTPRTGEIVAGYEVSDEYGIRPFHPVTGEPNVPHNGVDLATPVGVPIHAVGEAGDTVTVKCWWDVDGGGWVVDQTADSYAGYTFQSLHTSENGCRQGKAKAGEAIAYTGNSGIGTGAHYDFRVKIDGQYVPPATKYLESAITGEPPKE